MKLNHVLRKLWHSIYYAVTPETAHDYALTCREAVTEMNTTSKVSAQVKLHLSLCQACSNYAGYSGWLRKNFPKKSPDGSVDLSAKIFERLKD